MSSLLDLLGRVANDVVVTFASTWPFLLVSVVLAAAATVYIGTDRLRGLLTRRPVLAIGGAVVLATATPFCSCGTTAVLLGGLAATVPWAPLVAFLVSSPLTSPSELVFSAGLLSWDFAWFFFAGTAVLGVAAGMVAWGVERTGWLRGQARMEPTSCGSECSAPIGVGPGTASILEIPSTDPRTRLRRFGSEILTLGKRLLVLFTAFTAIGYLIIEAIPTTWLTDHLGGDSLLSVPLAALLGIPAYVNTEGSLPLIAKLMDGGMGPGPAMAFLITGAGTSLGAITGLLVIARRRVVGLVVALLIAGAIALGYLAGMVL